MRIFKPIIVKVDFPKLFHRCLLNTNSKLSRFCFFCRYSRTLQILLAGFMSRSDIYQNCLPNMFYKLSFHELIFSDVLQFNSVWVIISLQYFSELLPVELATLNENLSFLWLFFNLYLWRTDLVWRLQCAFNLKILRPQCVIKKSNSSRISFALIWSALLSSLAAIRILVILNVRIFRLHSKLVIE